MYIVKYCILPIKGGIYMKFKRRFSADLYHARCAAGLTQDKVAELIGISPRAYQYIEKGKTIPRGDTLLKLIYLFELDIDRYREALKTQSCD